jgi:integrase
MYPALTKTGQTIETNEDGNDNEELTIVNQNNTAFLNITTGKNAKRKGARFAAGRQETVDALKRIARRNYDLRLSDAIKKKAKDYVFMFKEFKSKKRDNLNAPDNLLRPTSFRRLFDTFLTELNLLYTAKGKKRQLYSLRHTYATIMLVHDAVSAHTLAKQMGTSIGMIEKHYSKLDAVRAIAQLRGEESRQLINSKSDWSLTE